MKRKPASVIFGAVDPNLRVVNGGMRRRTKDRENFEKAHGDECPRCHEEAWRFRPYDGVCFNCEHKLDVKEDRDLRNKAKFRKFREKHNARIGKKKGRAR